MPRPQKYARRVDTKVRLRQDHRDRLDDEAETRGISRNLVIEGILDAHFKTKAPRLAKAPVAPDLQRAAQASQSRTTPRLRHPGEEQAAQDEGDGLPPVVPPKTAKPAPPATEKTGPRVRPRQRRI